MKDLSKMSATELQQMLTNIYTVASAYEMEESTKLERITILFESDSSEKLDLLEHNPEEYFSQKYSQEPKHTEEAAVLIINSCNDIPALEVIKQAIAEDSPKYAPQTYERIMKQIYLCQNMISNPAAFNLTKS